MLILFSLIINSVFYYCIYSIYSTITFAFAICSNKESSHIGAPRDKWLIIKLSGPLRADPWSGRILVEVRVSYR